MFKILSLSKATLSDIARIRLLSNLYTNTTYIRTLFLHLFQNYLFLVKCAGRHYLFLVKCVGRLLPNIVNNY